MSTQFKLLPKAFVKHDAKLFEANTIAIGVENPVVREGSPAPLREGHIVLLAVDVLVALHASFKKWRNHRRTLRALAELDDRQLRDIGLTREAFSSHQNSYSAIAELDGVRRA